MERALLDPWQIMQSRRSPREGTAVLVVLIAAAQLGQHPPRHLPLLIEPPDDLLAKRAEEILGDSLAHLEDHIADETLADQHVGLSLVQAAAFDVADVAVLEPAVLQIGVRLAVQVGPFAVLAADIDQPDPRILDIQHVAGVDRPHDGVLIQMLRPRGGVGPHVHQHRLAAQIRQDDRDTGRFDALQIQPRAHPGGDDRAGVPGADHRVDRAFGHQLPADDDRAVRFFPQGFRRLFFHADGTLRRHEPQARASAAFFHQGSEQVRIADKVDFQIGVGFQSRDRTIDIRIGCVIAP